MGKNKTILVTGAAGSIGSAVIRHLVNHTDRSVVNLDKLTYAASLEALESVGDNLRHALEQADIADTAVLGRLFRQRQPDAVMHLAAGSHVDRSIEGPAEFIQTTSRAAIECWRRRSSINASSMVSGARVFGFTMSAPTRCTALSARAEGDATLERATDIEGQISKLELQRSEPRRRFTEGHPMPIALQQKLDQVRIRVSAT